MAVISKKQYITIQGVQFVFTIQYLVYTEFKTYLYIHYVKLTKEAYFTTKIIFSRIFKTSSLSLLAIWNYVCWTQGNKKRKIILVRLELWFPIPFSWKTGVSTFTEWWSASSRELRCFSVGASLKMSQTFLTPSWAYKIQLHL